MSAGYKFKTNSQLKNAVKKWCKNKKSAKKKYGGINTWDVSKIEDFSELFKDKSNFNSNISNWDVSNGSSFEGMFDNAKKRTDYDKIIRTFNIKIKKNGSNVSPIPLKMNIKRKIIQFVIHEPEDIFDYDHYISKI